MTRVMLCLFTVFVSFLGLQFSSASPIFSVEGDKPTPIRYTFRVERLEFGDSESDDDLDLEDCFDWDDDEEDDDIFDSEEEDDEEISVEDYEEYTSIVDENPDDEEECPDTDEQEDEEISAEDYEEYPSLVDEDEEENPGIEDPDIEEDNPESEQEYVEEEEEYPGIEEEEEIPDYSEDDISIVYYDEDDEENQEEQQETITIASAKIRHSNKHRSLHDRKQNSKLLPTLIPIVKSSDAAVYPFKVLGDRLRSIHRHRPNHRQHHQVHVPK